MSLKARCPSCGATYQVADLLLGKRVRCKGCSTAFVVRGADRKKDEVHDAVVVEDDDSSAIRPTRGTDRGRPSRVAPGPARRRDDDDEEDAPPRRRKKPAKGLSPVVLGGIIGGGVLAVLVLLVGVAWLVIRAKVQRPTAGSVVSAEASRVNPAAMAPANGAVPFVPGPARPPAAPWKVGVDPAPADLVVAEVPKVQLPVGPGADVLFPTTPSPFVVIGRNITDKDNRVLYDLRTGQQAGGLNGKLDGFSKTAVSADGEYFAGIPLVTLKTVDVWSLKTGMGVSRININQTGFIDVMDFAEPGQVVTVSTGNQLKKVVQLWDVKTGQKLREIQGTASLYAQAHALSPGRRYLALFSDKALHVFDLKDGAENELDLLGTEFGMCQGIAFAPDGAGLACCIQGSASGRIIAIDVASGKITADHKFPQPLNLMVPNAFSHTGPPLEWLADGSGWLVYGDTAIDRAQGTPYFSLAGKGVRTQLGPHKVASKSQLLVVVAGKGFNRTLDTVPLDKAPAGGVVQAGAGPDAGPVKPADWSGARMLQPAQTAGGGLEPDPLGALAGMPQMPLDLRTEPADMPKGQAGLPSQILFTRPEVGQVLTVSPVTPSSKFSPRTWRADRFDLLTGKHLGGIDGIARVVQSFTLRSLDYAEASPDGTRLLVRDLQNDGRLDLWALDAGKHLAAWVPYEKEPAPRVAWAAFADTAHVWTIHDGGKLALWSLPDCRATLTLDALPHSRPALSAGGKYLAVARGTGIDLLDTATGEARGRLDLPAGVGSPHSLALAWRHDGKELATLLHTSGATGVRYVVARWDLTTGKPAGDFTLADPAAATVLRYCGSRHLLVNGMDLLDLDARRIFVRYQLAGMPASRTPDGRVWFPVSGLGGPALSARTLPDDKSQSLTTRLQAAQPIIQPGSTIAVRLDARGTVPEIDRRRKEIADLVTLRLRNIGLEPGDQGTLTLAIQLQDADTGETMTLEQFGPQRQTLRLPVKKLTWQATLADDRGTTLWQDKKEATTRGFGFRVFKGDPAVELQKELWQSANGWAGGLMVPNRAVRLDGKLVTLPQTIPLTLEP